MAEYIKREAAIDRFQGLKDKCESLRDAIYLDGVIAVLDTLPAADVAEVRHGRWIFEPGKIPYCSECKEYSDDGDKGATFCPWCGVRMDKEDEHDVERNV